LPSAPESLLKKILLSFFKPLQNIFAFTDGYSVSHLNEEGLITNCSAELINSLKIEEFKKLCAEYFAEKSYQAKEDIQLGSSHIDIGLFKQSYSNSQPFGVVKCWSTKAIPVTQDDVNQFKSVLNNKKIPFGAFITAGKFIQENNNDDKRLQLIDAEKLASLIQALPELRKKRLLNNIINRN